MYSKSPYSNGFCGVRVKSVPVPSISERKYVTLKKVWLGYLKQLSGVIFV